VVNTDVKIGGKDTSILTQSPRKTVVESPRDVIGLTDIELTEGNVTLKDQYRNIALRLSAEKLRLKKGEQTTLTVQVMGLQELQEEIPFSLENKSPTVVSMEGGEVQTVTVHPEEVGSEGVYTISRTLTGIQTGPFTISARISPEYMTVPLLIMPGDENDQVKKCVCQQLEVKFDKEKARRYQEKGEPEKGEKLKNDEELKNGETRISLTVPIQYRTKCKGINDKTAVCKAKITVKAERKKNWKKPEPVSEGIKPEQIECSQECPPRRTVKWGEWKSQELIYKIRFDEVKQGELNKKEEVKFELTADKCGGSKELGPFDLYYCECNKIRLAFRGAEKWWNDPKVVPELGLNKKQVDHNETPSCRRS